MMRARRKQERWAKGFCAAGLAVLLVSLPGDLGAREKSGKFLPELHSGDILRYEIHGRVQRHVKTESLVSSILGPRDEKQEFSGELRITIKNVSTENGRPVVGARVEFVYPESGPEAGADAGADAGKHFVEITVGGSGQVKNLTGDDDLEPMERMAWQFWVARFAFGWTLPVENVKRGQKWKSEEPENHPAPIARLMWERVTTYGQEEKCPAVAAETCAVFYTNAVLKQKSSVKDSTPDDYRLRELKTSGTATGVNEIYTTISEKTGLMVRGTEDVRQSMKVVIGKADMTNAVRYTVEAGSHFEMVMVGQ